MQAKLPLLVRVETGTDSEVRVIVNPVLLLLAQIEMWRMQAIAEMFGIEAKPATALQ